VSVQFTFQIPSEKDSSTPLKQFSCEHGVALCFYRINLQVDSQQLPKHVSEVVFRIL